MVASTPLAGPLNLEDVDYANEEFSHDGYDHSVCSMQSGNGGIFRAIVIPLLVFGASYKGTMAET